MTLLKHEQIQWQRFAAVTPAIFLPANVLTVHARLYVAKLPAFGFRWLALDTLTVLH